MDYFIAIDHGGSKTAALAIADDGRVISSYIQANQVRSIGVSETKWIGDIFNAAVHLARSGGFDLNKSAGVCLSLNGINSPADANRARNEIANALSVQDVDVVNDSVAALRGGVVSWPRKGNVAVLSAGSGMNCCLRTCVGEIRNLGWRINNNDQGGYGLGRRVWNAVVDDYNGLGEKTLLRGMLLSAFELNSTEELLNEVSSGRIMFIPERYAIVLFDAAAKGDVVAKRIIDEVAFRWVRYIEILSLDAKANANEQLRLFLSGGIFNIDNGFMAKALREHSLKRELKVSIRRAMFEPVVGAAFLFIDKMRGDKRKIVENFLASIRQHDVSPSYHVAQGSCGGQQALGFEVNDIE